MTVNNRKVVWRGILSLEEAQKMVKEREGFVKGLEKDFKQHSINQKTLEKLQNLLRSLVYQGING